jgi:hypothetical protein
LRHILLHWHRVFALLEMSAVIRRATSLRIGRLASASNPICFKAARTPAVVSSSPAKLNNVSKPSLYFFLGVSTDACLFHEKEQGRICFGCHGESESKEGKLNNNR